MNTPSEDHTTDTQINELFELYVEPLTSECATSVREELAIRARAVVETDPIYGVVFTARDPETFDPDPESANNVIGYGTSREQAIDDLVGQLLEGRP